MDTFQPFHKWQIQPVLSFIFITLMHHDLGHSRTHQLVFQGALQDLTKKKLI